MLIDSERERERESERETWFDKVHQITAHKEKHISHLAADVRDESEMSRCDEATDETGGGSFIS